MKRYKPLFKYFKYIQKLDENIRLSDLTKNQGSSDMSLRFKKERNKIMGSETRVSKLQQCNILQNGDVDFIFVSEATDKYPPDYQYGQADIDNNYDIKNNPGQQYIITIRVIGVLDWLETYTDKSEITPKDIKDILSISDILIDSNVPSFYWQGGAYYLQQLGGAIYKEPIIAPKFWNKPEYHGDGNFFIDKITQSVINQIAFFRNLMASMLTKQLKDKKII